MMRRISILTLTLILTGAIASAQDNQRDEQRDHHEQKQDQRPPRDRRTERKGKPEHVQKPAPRAQSRPEQARGEHPHRSWKDAHAWQQRRGWEKGGWHGGNDWHGERAAHWQSEHRTWAQRGGYGGYYIPHARFHLYFGRDHWFRIRTRPVIYMGYPRFAYQGLSFMLVDPYPEDWNDNWYESDDVYIDYSGDGYYLYNRSHPGIALAVSVVQ